MALIDADEMRDLKIALSWPEADDAEVHALVRNLYLSGWRLTRRSVVEREAARACRLAAAHLANELHRIGTRLDELPDRDVWRGEFLMESLKVSD